MTADHVLLRDGPVVRMVAVSFPSPDGEPMEQDGTELLAIPVRCRACGWEHTAVAYRPTGEGVQAAVDRTTRLHLDYVRRQRKGE